MTNEVIKKSLVELLKENTPAKKRERKTTTTNKIKKVVYKKKLSNEQVDIASTIIFNILVDKMDHDENILRQKKELILLILNKIDMMNYAHIHKAIAYKILIRGKDLLMSDTLENPRARVVIDLRPHVHSLPYIRRFDYNYGSSFDMMYVLDQVTYGLTLDDASYNTHEYLQTSSYNISHKSSSIKYLKTSTLLNKNTGKVSIGQINKVNKILDEYIKVNLNQLNK
jgi:hypothetical protein